MQPQKQTRGTIEAAPCPWCAKPHKFSGFRDYGLVPDDARYQCVADSNGPGCNRYFRIARVETVTAIWLVPSN